VLHLSREGFGEFLSHRLQQNTSLKCEVAKNGTSIKRGHIYVAPPNHHTIVKEGYIQIVDGPEENRFRPSIDVMFRSAAVAYGERVIGLILTGLLDDGTAGMRAIKKCGGHTLIQDPNEADYPDMPLSVLNSMEVDHCLPLSQLGYVVHDIVANAKLKGVTIPEELIKEASIAENSATGAEALDPLGERSVYGCPDCGGVLWEIKENGHNHYRCQIGHSYSTNDLLKKQLTEIESTLWVAVRLMEERKNLLTKFAGSESKKGLIRLGQSYEEKAADLSQHITRLKDLIFTSEKE
jgi:two-component system chemotaxis response regulator CheB